MQFRALKEAVKDSLKNLGFALDSSLGKFSKSVDDKIYKLNTAQNSRQPEDLNRDRQGPGTCASDPMRKGR